MTSIRRKRSNRSRKRKSVRRRYVRRRSVRRKSIRRKRSNRSRKRKSIRRKSVRRRSVRRKSMKGGIAGAAIAAAGAGALTIGKTGKIIYDLKQDNKRLQRNEEELKEEHATAIQKKEEEHATAIQNKEDEHTAVLQRKDEEHATAIQNKEDEHTAVLQRKDEEHATAIQDKEDEHTAVLQRKDEEHAKAIQDTHVLFREERNKLLQLQAKHEEENKNRQEQHDKLVHSAHELDIILNKPKAREIFRLATGGENGVIHFDDFKDCMKFSYTDEITDVEIDFLEDVFNEESEGGNIYETEMSIEEFVNFILRKDFEIDLDDMIKCLKQKHK